jgi:hypothetical protein
METSFSQRAHNPESPVNYYFVSCSRYACTAITDLELHALNRHFQRVGRDLGCAVQAPVPMSTAAVLT